MKAAELDSLFARYGEVMTPFEIATTVRCSDSHIYELLTRGDLPCFCVGRHYRILKTDAISCFRRLVPPPSNSRAVQSLVRRGSHISLYAHPQR